MATNTHHACLAYRQVAGPRAVTSARLSTMWANPAKEQTTASSITGYECDSRVADAEFMLAIAASISPPPDGFVERTM